MVCERYDKITIIERNTNVITITRVDLATNNLCTQKVCGGDHVVHEQYGLLVAGVDTKGVSHVVVAQRYLKKGAKIVMRV